MRFFFSALAVVPSLLGSVFLAEAAPGMPHQVDAILAPRASTCNTASNRACWTTGFNINTDYEVNTPTTGVTRHYTLVVTEERNWTGPDGQVKDLVMLINGTIPGPVIQADWGDMLSITVVNKLKQNGTSMHWHGIRQLNTNLQDGVNGVTECPIPPRSSRVYTFLAQQYGTTWYHSHFSAQYGNGVVGTILINGPASLPYDIDLGVFPVSDYYYHTADYLVEYTKNNGPPASDNVLFNGTNISPLTGKGKYANVTLTPGKRHRLRIINTSVENHFVFSLANHTMTIIESDLVPVNAQTVTQLFVGVGQRYDVTIDASQPIGNYWFNATFVTNAQCGSSVNPAPAAIFHYAGASGGLPTNAGATITQSTCADLSNLTPVVQRTVSTSGFVANSSNELAVTLDLTEANQLFTWKIDGTQMVIDWEDPVDQFLMNGQYSSLPPSDNTIVVNKTNQWVFWVIENDPTIGIAHPMHLHGHDFLVVGRADFNNPSAFTASDVSSFNGNNPTRRDVVMLPPLGWVAIAFKTDNPGTWLMHCHIAWHVSGGLAVNFVERPADFKAGVCAADKAAFTHQCSAWNTYYPSHDPDRQDDSGLRKRSGISSRFLGVGSFREQ